MLAEQCDQIVTFGNCLHEHPGVSKLPQTQNWLTLLSPLFPIGSLFLGVDGNQSPDFL
uniref:Uncharacterized protein n=1 Tax=Anguilla anguilla TaxID=7936 RepID=A0A0E9VJE1_ANGAN